MWQDITLQMVMGNEYIATAIITHLEVNMETHTMYRFNMLGLNQIQTQIII